MANYSASEISNRFQCSVVYNKPDIVRTFRQKKLILRITEVVFTSVGLCVI